MLALESTPHDQHDFRLLLDTVREAGSLAMTLFRQRVRNWNKADGSPVTEADIAVDRLLRRKLTGARPTYGWLSEETPDDLTRSRSDKFWVADPIDGTRAFVNGTDEWCIAVALVTKGRPLMAAVYRPVPEEFYEAAAGQGSRLNGSLLTTPERHAIGGSRVVGSRGALKKIGASIEAHGNTDVPIALRLCLVASGVYDAAVSTGRKHDWDVAAGDLILFEAGGAVTDLHGQPYRFNRAETWQSGMVAASKPLHHQILRVVGESDGESK